MLSQDYLSDLFRTLRDRYDFIIVDTAPVLLVTDSLIISQHVDAVIFSILREVSQIPRVVDRDWNRMIRKAEEQEEEEGGTK